MPQDSYHTKADPRAMIPNVKSKSLKCINERFQLYGSQNRFYFNFSINIYIDKFTEATSLIS